NHYTFNCQLPTQLLISHRSEQPFKQVIDFLTSTESRVLFCAETAGRREVLIDLLKENHIPTETFSSWRMFLSSDVRLGITQGPLTQGISLTHPAIEIITESQLFGEQ